MKANIGTRIRDARLARKLTQKALAQLLSVDQTTVSDWETDQNRRPNRDVLPKLAAVLHRTPEWLEGRPGAEDRGAHWDDGRRAAAPAPGDELANLDEALLVSVIGVALKQLVSRYGVNIEPRKIDDAAAAAANAYATYFRLKADDHAA